MITIELTGQQMIDMGWEIGNDQPLDQYQLHIDADKEEITASILSSNGEYNDSGFTFDFVDTIDCLRSAGHITTNTVVFKKLVTIGVNSAYAVIEVAEGVDRRGRPFRRVKFVNTSPMASFDASKKYEDYEIDFDEFATVLNADGFTVEETA